MALKERPCVYYIQSFYPLEDMNVLCKFHGYLHVTFGDIVCTKRTFCPEGGARGMILECPK